MKARIIDYITSNKSQEVINQFLFMNKLENLDKIFEKFESPLIYPELDAKNKICKEYQEIKVDDINFMYVKKEEKCKCELCTSDAACIQKVCDLNKSRMEIVNNSSIDYLKKEITPEDIIKKNNSCIVFHNNEELFYQGKSEKKSNTIFSKSKTIFDERGRLEFIPQPISISHPTTFVKEEKTENTESNAVNAVNENENTNEDKKINNDEVIPSEFDKNIQEVQGQEKNVDMEMDMDALSDNSPKKSFKNISKSEKKPTEEEVNIENDIAIKSEGKEPHESEIEKNDEDNSEDETKNIKKEKKSRKGKSRKKNNNKKKESISKNEGKDFENDENEEQKEEEKKDKSVKKKRKSTNRSSLKKNKSKICAKNEENEEKEETYESEEINFGNRSEINLEVDSISNNSIKKKS